MVKSYRSLVALATVVDKHWLLKWPLLLQQKHRASLAGHKFRGQELFPQHLHNVIVHKFTAAGIAGSFLLGPCLATKSTSPSLLGFVTVSCCSFTAPSVLWSFLPYQGLALLPFGDVLTVRCLRFQPQEVTYQFILHVFEITTISQAMNFWNKLVYWFFRELVSFIKMGTFKDHVFCTWK